jgi:plastocyanin
MGPAGEGAVEIVTVDSAFTPETLELNAGQKVTVEITNEDVVPHDFEIEVLDLSTGTIEAGEIATATFTVPEGTTEFACTYHSGMTGRIETS